MEDKEQDDLAGTETAETGIPAEVVNLGVDGQTEDPPPPQQKSTIEISADFVDAVVDELQRRNPPQEEPKPFSPEERAHFADIAKILALTLRNDFGVTAREYPGVRYHLDALIAK